MDQLMNFLATGRETTATTLTWAIYLFVYIQIFKTSSVMKPGLAYPDIRRQLIAS